MAPSLQNHTSRPSTMNENPDPYSWDPDDAPSDEDGVPIYNYRQIQTIVAQNTKQTTRANERRGSPYPIPRRNASEVEPWFLEQRSPYQLLQRLSNTRGFADFDALARADPLAQNVMDSWTEVEPTAQSVQYTKRLMSRLSGLVNGIDGRNHNGKPCFEVDVFGSVAWGGETGSSGDLDLVIRVSAVQRTVRADN